MALITPFAQNGDKKEIPQNTSDGSVSFDRGFGSFYALPPEEGGLFIDRAQFNQLMFDTTSQVLENKQQITAQANRINEVNTTLTQSINTKANSNATVNLTGNQTIAGTKTFTSNITAPNITAMQNNLNTIFSSTSSPVKTQTTDKIITVGSGGDFQDLLSAIYEARKYTSLVEIRLVSDLQINQDILITRINGSHIVINFQNYKITNTSSKDVVILMQCSNIGGFHNLNLENISLHMAACSMATLTGTININKNLSATNVSAIDIIQLSLLHIAFSCVLTINDTANINLITSQYGSIISIAGNATINSTKNTGNLFSVYNGGILSLPHYITINKPSGLNLYNTAVNTPSGQGLILDKAGRR